MRWVACAALLIVVLAAVAGIASAALWRDGMPGDTLSVAAAAPPASIPIAVLGDSNSHSYQDSLSFPPGSAERGGALRPRTFQWTEVLAQLRGAQLDPGPWTVWGRPGNVAWVRELIGLEGGRAPRKQDYLYNFANSGAACKNLMGSRGGQRFRQAPRLVALMDKNPARWRHGVVVIRIGQNNWGALLDVQARDPASPELKAATDYCVEQIGAAIRLIHARHPATRVLVAGVLNEADDPAQFERYRSAAETANLKTALAGFNGALQKLASGGDLRVAYFDDAGWFARLWGSRGTAGEPAYKTVEIGGVLQVGNNKLGNAPDNALLADDHAGLVWNVLWAQALVARLKEAFNLPLTPIGDEEVARFVAQTIKARGS